MIDSFLGWTAFGARRCSTTRLKCSLSPHGR
jgi:hypothetical protein